MTEFDSLGRRKGVISTSYEKTCVECGLPFTSKRVDARFCNGTCHSRWYHRENREKLRERKRRYTAAHKEERKQYLAGYYAEHGERVKAERRARYALDGTDPEKADGRRASRQEYYQQNREQVIQQAGRYRSENREQARAYRKRSQHGTDWEILFRHFWEIQDGKCYLCSASLDTDNPREVHLDHDHSCCPLGRSCERCRRGLACRECNYLIGIAKDDPARLRRIADNLEEANAAVRERMRWPRETPAATSWEMTCERCGAPFVAFRQDARYCSKKCSKAAAVARAKARKGQQPLLWLDASGDLRYGLTAR